MEARDPAGIGSAQFRHRSGGDRDDLRVSEAHEALILEAAGKAGRTVVVLEAGGPIETEAWLDAVDGLVMAWYPGMEGGTALGELLFGDANFSGKLPQTWLRIRPASHGPFGKSMAAADRADKAELLLDVEEAVPASAGEEAGAEPAPAPESPADRCAQFNEREASRRRNHQGPCPYCPCSCTDGKVACAPCVACQRDEPLPTPAPAPEPPAR